MTWTERRWRPQLRIYCQVQYLDYKFLQLNVERKHEKKQEEKKNNRHLRFSDTKGKFWRRIERRKERQRKYIKNHFHCNHWNYHSKQSSNLFIFIHECNILGGESAQRVGILKVVLLALFFFVAMPKSLFCLQIKSGSKNARNRVRVCSKSKIERKN